MRTVFYSRSQQVTGKGVKPAYRAYHLLFGRVGLWILACHGLLLLNAQSTPDCLLEDYPYEELSTYPHRLFADAQEEIQKGNLTAAQRLANRIAAERGTDNWYVRFLKAELLRASGQAYEALPIYEAAYQSAYDYEARGFILRAWALAARTLWDNPGAIPGSHYKQIAIHLASTSEELIRRDIVCPQVVLYGLYGANGVGYVPIIERFLFYLQKFAAKSEEDLMMVSSKLMALRYYEWVARLIERVTPDLQSENPEFLRMTGTCFYMMGEWQKAKKTLSEYLAQKPADTTTRLYYIVALTHLGEYRAALEQFREVLPEALLSEPHALFAILKSAHAEAQTGLFERTLQLFIENLQERPVLLNYLARFESEYQDVGRMVRYRMESQLSDTLKGIEHLQAGLNLLREKKYTEASQALQQANSYLPGLIRRRNLGPYVNSYHHEHSGVITPDGRILYFARQHAGSYEQTYQAEYVASSWQHVKKLPYPVNVSNNHCDPIAINATGDVLLTYIGSNGGDIGVTRLTPEGWTEPYFYSYPVNTSEWEPSAFLSYDNKALYICSNREGGVGGLDIYGFDVGEGYSRPILLPEPLNSTYDERLPLFLPDGKSVFFASDRPGGEGGFDIYFTQRQPDGTWMPPVNLGPPINTSGSEADFSIPANLKYFLFTSSQKGGFGGYDIYALDISGLFEMMDKIDNRKPLRPRVVQLSGRVHTAYTREPLQTRIVVTDSIGAESLQVLHNHPETGRYVVYLPSGKRYTVCFNSDDYRPLNLLITVPDDKPYTEVEKDIQLRVPYPYLRENGALDVILFGIGSPFLLPSELPKLKKVLEFLRAEPEAELILVGHADSTGDPRINEWLALRRAESVKWWLVRQGIPPRRLHTVGLGSRKPIASNSTEEGRRLNRRVEFLFRDEYEELRLP